jgi:membrane-bound ClpP family serine protease
MQHHAVLLLFVAVALFVFATILIGIEAFVPGIGGNPALFFFILGQLMVFLAVVYAACEIYVSHVAVAYEAEEVMNYKIK